MNKDADSLNRIKELVIDLDAEEEQKVFEEALAAGVPPYKFMMEAG